MSFPNRLSSPRRRVVLFALTLTLAFSSVFARQAFDLVQNAYAAEAPAMASLNLVIAVAQDGIAAMNTTADSLNGASVCPSVPTAGCDFSQTNGIVRTNDAVVYSYDYNVNGASEDITLTATAPLGTVWNVLPAFCLAGSAKNNGDGITTPSVITCKRGVQVTGTTESLPFTANVLGSASNGKILTATGTVSGPSSTTAVASAPNVTVSAAPRFNIRLTYSNTSVFTLSGVAGYRFEYRAMLEVYDNSTPAAYNPWYGSEALASPVTFTNVVSGISPNAVLQSCAKQSDNGGAAGTITCSQPGGAAQNISVSIANANTTLSQWSTAPSDGRFLAGSYQIFIFVPDTDVLNAPGQSLSTTNTLTGFDPNSISGQSNFGAGTELLTDNTVTRNMTPLTGSFSTAFVADYNNGSSSAFGLAVGSNRFVGPNDIFATQVSFNNNTGSTLTDLVMCDVMDNTRYSVIETSPGSGMVSGTASPAPTSIEYATGYVNPNWRPTTSSGNPTGIRTECNDPSVAWYSSPTAVPGGLAAITKYRVRYATLAANVTGTVRVRVQARENNYYTSQTNFAGDVLANYAIWRSAEISPNFVNNNYFPNVYPNNASGSPGTRLFLARATARINKETESNNTVNSVATGGTIGYVLKPTLTSLGPANPVQVTVMDVMPPGLSYIVGTGTQNNASFEPQIVACTGNAAPDSHCAGAGRQLLVWTLNNQTPNAAIQPISFRAAADLTVLNNQTVINTAIVSTPSDPAQESLRTATRSVVGASPSTLLISKNTATPQIEVNSPYSYVVSYRNASIANDFTDLDFIDVLPFNGDASLLFDAGSHLRTPASVFTGTSLLTGVAASTSAATWYFTNADPTIVNISPKAAENLNPGGPGSVWCAGTASGPAAGCGFTIAQATAVRLLDGTPMPRGTAIRTFTVNLLTSGNHANDRYTNNAAGTSTEFALAISSNNVPVVVLESSLSGTVWYDTNGDGVRGVEETGRVDGAAVTLSGTDSHNNPVSRSTTTSGGTYSFAQLPSGTYTVTFGRPAGYKAGLQDNGSDDTIDSDGDVVTLATHPISLGINDAKGSVDQGFYRMDLSGSLWNDLNVNGTLDVGEPGVSGQAVELLSGSTVVATTQSNAAGGYLFQGIAAGDYRVRVTRGIYYATSNVNANPNDNVDGDNNGSISGVYFLSGVITLAPGTEPTLDQATGVTLNSTVDFGMLTAPTAAEVVLSGRVMEPGGRGLGRAAVTLIVNGTIRTALSNPFGYYRFTGIRAGEAVIVVVSAKNRTFENNQLFLVATDNTSGVDFVAN